MQLGVSHAQAVGLVAMLHARCEQHRPEGDIGFFHDAEIAELLGWEGDTHELLSALFESEWIERCAVHRWVVARWSDFVSEATRRRLRRAGRALVEPVPVEANAANATDASTEAPIAAPSAAPLEPATATPDTQVDAAPLFREPPVDRPTTSGRPSVDPPPDTSRITADQCPDDVRTLVDPRSLPGETATGTAHALLVPDLVTGSGERPGTRPGRVKRRARRSSACAGSSPPRPPGPGKSRDGIDVRPGDVASPAAVERLRSAAEAAGMPWSSSPADRLAVQTLAVYALRNSTVTPERLFAWNLRRGERRGSAEDEAAGRERLRELDAPPDADDPAWSSPAGRIAHRIAMRWASSAKPPSGGSQQPAAIAAGGAA